MKSKKIEQKYYQPLAGLRQGKNRAELKECINDLADALEMVLKTFTDPHKGTVVRATVEDIARAALNRAGR